MSWQKVGGGGGLGIYAWTPDAPGGEPPTAVPAPPTDQFFTGEANIECEFGLVYPCLERTPIKARWMLQWQECNCEDENPLTEPGAICVHCFSLLVNNLDSTPYTTCGGCDLHYVPSRAIIRDLVELP